MKRNLWLRVYDIIQPYKGKLILSMFSLLALLVWGYCLQFGGQSSWDWPYLRGIRISL